MQIDNNQASTISVCQSGCHSKCLPREGKERDKHGAEGEEEHLKEEQAIGVLRC